MNRLDFLKMMSITPLSGSIAGLSTLEQYADPLLSTEPMPVFFFGHGSPMNAIELNEFSIEWERIGQTLPRPNAILCISAHWLTRGTLITGMARPRTIHDFGGFPDELFRVEYPAPGSPELAGETVALLPDAALDEAWGLDHGCWSVVKHLYPEADVPVIQMSIDYHQPAQYHYDLARRLAVLRRKGILIVGSGNMVHNLRMVAWEKMDEPGFAFDWATEANEQMKYWIGAGDHRPLIDFTHQGKAFDLAIPTPDHYFPMLYALALQENKDELHFFNDKAVMGSLTMTSFRIGKS
ncbi:4,5-DOPA-extradiol-dioxygenase [Taibaiella koreensis]|uniref:4,5-DOPA-extradiol-dioxygenase n=1 Tax=Taibaiella koreensis TaxID=1268548 RepID=UPI000E5A003D|nr:4,5-DOPA dioxygenase extradiol [Taibaiella koreensis]